MRLLFLTAHTSDKILMLRPVIPSCGFGLQLNEFRLYRLRIFHVHAEFTRNLRALRCSTDCGYLIADFPLQAHCAAGLGLGVLESGIIVAEQVNIRLA